MSISVCLRTTRKLLSLIAVLVILTGCTANSRLAGLNFGSITSSISAVTVADTPIDAEITAQAVNIEALSAGLVGHQIGVELASADKQLALNAEYEALEYSPTGQTIVWQNTSTGTRGEVTPSKTYDLGQKNCRRYVHKIFIADKVETASGAACKEQDGAWIPLG